MSSPNESDVEVGFAADLSGLLEGFQKAVEHTKEGGDQIKESLGGIGEVVEALQASFLGLGATILSAFGLKEVINQIVTTTFELDKMSSMIGESMEETKLLGQELNAAGTSLENYAHLIRMVTMRINTQEQAYKDAKVAIRDHNGELLPTEEILANITKRLEDYKQGQDRNTMAMRLAGRGYQELIALQRLDMVDKEKLKTLNEDLARVVGEENVKAAVEYNTAMEEVKAVLEAGEKVIADAFMPVLQQLGEWFADVGPDALRIFKVAIDVVAGAFWDMKLGIEVIWAVIKAFVLSVTDSLVAFAHVADRAMHLDWTGVKAAWVKGMEDIVGEVKKAGDEIMDATAGFEDHIRKLAHPPENDPKKKGSLRAPPGGSQDTSDPEAGFMKQFEDQWARKKLIYEDENQLRKLSKNEEADFWESALQYVKKSEDAESTYQQIVQKATVARLEARHQEIEDGMKITSIMEEAQVKAAKDAIEAKKEELNQRVKLGQVTHEEELRQLEAFENEQFEIEQTAYQAQLDQYKDEPVKYAEMLAKIEEAKRKHNLELTKLDNQIAIEQNKTWVTVFDSIKSAFDTSVKGIIAGTQTLRNALINIANAIGTSLVNELAVKPFLEYLKNQVLMTKVTETQTAERTAIQEEGAAAGLLSSAKSVLASIGNFAAEAFAGVWAALSGIPIVGPEMAAAAAPAAMATVLGIGGTVMHSSAGGDWMIPSDRMNMVHARETILPADKSEKLDRMLNMGGGGAMNVTIHAMDAASVKRLFMDHGSALADALRHQVRNFKPVTTR